MPLLLAFAVVVKAFKLAHICFFIAFTALTYLYSVVLLLKRKKDLLMFKDIFFYYSSDIKNRKTQILFVKHILSTAFVVLSLILPTILRHIPSTAFVFVSLVVYVFIIHIVALK